MKAVPTTWDDTEFIEGYPGKYVVLSRKHGDTTYTAGVNAGPGVQKIKLPAIKGKKGMLYIDKSTDTLEKKEVKLNGKEIELTPNCGFVLITE